MKILFLILLVIGLLTGDGYAVSASDGLTASGLISSNTHTHISTSPVKVYAITVTPTANGGFAQLIETNNAAQDAAYAGVGLDGFGFVSGRDAWVKADIQGATANGTIHVTYPDGLVVSENLFVDCQSAVAEIYYKH